MFDSEWDPYEILQRLQLESFTVDQELTGIKQTQERQAQLMELMAKQVKHLTNAVIGLQTENERLRGILVAAVEPHRNDTN